MKRSCVIVLAVAALATTAAPAAKAQKLVIPTCIGMEMLHPVPKCGPQLIPACNWGATATCRLSSKWGRPAYGSRCTAWHCHYVGPP